MKDDHHLEPIAERVGASAFHRWAGLEVLRVAPGEVDVALDIGDHHLNLIGLLHGGMIATVADTAMGLAMRTLVPAGSSHVTVQLNVHYVAPARKGRVVGEGRVVKSGRRMGVAQARVLDDGGRLLATGSATFFLVSS
ncbi:MAG TPA: PaaI family thioesterase [Actinomycetota bacterium]|nr:PaaI family thioesterase [Actinomycetota bacterium]